MLTSNSFCYTVFTGFAFLVKKFALLAAGLLKINIFLARKVDK